MPGKIFSYSTLLYSFYFLDYGPFLPSTFIAPQDGNPMHNYLPVQPGLTGQQVPFAGLPYNPPMNGFGHPHIYPFTNNIPNDPYRGFPLNPAPFNSFNGSNYGGSWVTESKPHIAPSLFSTSIINVSGHSPLAASAQPMVVSSDPKHPTDVQGPVSPQFVEKIQGDARHAYFSLLIEQGKSLSTPISDFPFISLTQLFSKYQVLFGDGVRSISSFYQLCTFAIPELNPISLGPTELSRQTNQFQFQSDGIQEYPQIRPTSKPSGPSHSEASSFKSNLFSSFNSGPRKLSEVGSNSGLGFFGADEGYNTSNAHIHRNQFPPQPTNLGTIPSEIYQYVNYNSISNQPSSNYSAYPFLRQPNSEYPNLNPPYPAD